MDVSAEVAEPSLVGAQGVGAAAVGAAAFVAGKSLVWVWGSLAVHPLARCRHTRQRP